MSPASAARAATVTVPVPAERAGADRPWDERDLLAAPRWVSGLLSGIQAALMSVLVVAVPALAAYVATSADPANADVVWPRAVAVGAALWLMGHGAMLQVGDAVVSIVPLGITALALFACYASARRSARASLSAWAAGIGGYAAIVAVTVLATGSVGPMGAGAASVVRLSAGVLVIAAVGLGTGMVRARSLRELTRPWWSRLPPTVRTSVVGGTLVTASLVGVAAVVTGVWALAGRAATGDVIDGLGLDTLGGVLFALAQLALVPNLVLWAVAWLAGPGFAVGAGTVFSPDQVVSGPLPAVPMLGALPPPGSEGGVLRWVPVVVVLAGALAGWWLHRRTEVTVPWQPFANVAATALAAGVLTGAGCVLAGGSAGPGRLGVVGASALVVGLAVAGLTAVGALATAVPSEPVVREATVRRARGLGRRLRDRLGATRR